MGVWLGFPPLKMKEIGRRRRPSSMRTDARNVVPHLLVKGCKWRPLLWHKLEFPQMAGTYGGAFKLIPLMCHHGNQTCKKGAGNGREDFWGKFHTHSYHVTMSHRPLTLTVMWTVIICICTECCVKRQYWYPEESLFSENLTWIIHIWLFSAHGFWEQSKCSSFSN